MTLSTCNRPLPDLVVPGAVVPLLPAGEVVRANLDHAASAAPLRAVANEVTTFLFGGRCAAIHRGLYQASAWCTRVYEDARDVVRRFFAAPADAVVIWTNNTTGAINTIAHAVTGRVVTTGLEHHANLLPWQRGDFTLLPVPTSPGQLLDMLATELARSPVQLVTITGASNVTGEIPPLREVSDLAHHHGALVCVDAAQLAAHHPITMTDLGVDLLVWSGHKLGAPLGVGGIVAAPSAVPLLTAKDPFIRGGAVVNFVHPDGHVDWVTHPEGRHEPGSPNVVGVIATAAAMTTLMGAGMGRVAAEETRLLAIAEQVLATVPGLRVLRVWPESGCDRIGVITFTVAGWGYSRLAAALATEYGIDTRHGCFCAHPLMAHLLGITEQQAREIGRARAAGGPVPGAVRVSFGLDTTAHTIIRLVEALHRLVEDGPRWTYRTSPDLADCWPDPDPRPGWNTPPRGR